MSRGVIADLLDFSGTLFVVQFHWYWMAVALGLGAWVGWRVAAEPPPGGQPEETE